MTISKIGGPKLSNQLQQTKSSQSSPSNFADSLRARGQAPQHQVRAQRELPHDYAAANSPYAKLQQGIPDGSEKHTALDQVMSSRAQLLNSLHTE